MSKIFIKRPKNPQCFDGISILIEFILLLGLGYFFRLYGLLISFGVLAVYFLISYLLYRKYPEGTLYSNDGVLYYYHNLKLHKIPFEDIKSVTLQEGNKKFVINYNLNNENKNLTIRNYESDMLVIELKKTIHKYMHKDKK